jgi:hypothetical protein
LRYLAGNYCVLGTLKSVSVSKRMPRNAESHYAAQSISKLEKCALLLRNHMVA